MYPGEMALPMIPFSNTTFSTDSVPLALAVSFISSSLNGSTYPTTRPYCPLPPLCFLCR